MDGFLNILKPPGMTSFDLIRTLRGRWKKEKMGHAGTLDLPACGVVVVALDKATKFLPYLPGDKEYVFEVIFGLETDTFDLWGKVLKEKGIVIDPFQIESVIKDFRGKILQEIPPFSSKHEGGRRFYQIAEEEYDSISSRFTQVEIMELNLLDYCPGKNPLARFWVHCSAGTYVRSLAKAIGQALDGAACAGFIVRTRSGRFSISEAHPLEDYLKGQEPIPIGEAFLDLPQIVLPDSSLKYFFNGQSFISPLPVAKNTLLSVKDRRGNFLGLAKSAGSYLRAEKVLP